MFNKKYKKEIKELSEKITEQESLILSKSVEIFSLNWQLGELKKEIEKLKEVKNDYWFNCRFCKK